MSKSVDNKVVSMEFDNSKFESNVKTSMSTLDKLKQALNFDGASKGFEKIESESGKVHMSGLSGAVDTVKSRFSAMEVIAVTALANITNSAVNAAKNLITEFTITPITTGFQEYELKMNSVQTIMASTGESLETVNSYLEELNKYSDQTIYSFSDMTNNIGKFTNAGVKLEDAVQAIKGVSNEAAVSGANAEEASRAMYNFAQALSAGYVKLIDWKSIENANMATVEFKNQLIETAVEMGTLTKTADGLYDTGKHTISATKEFNDSLTDAWMTSEVLIKTLAKYSDETTEIGKKAYASAQDVKTFSMMMDTLKEAVQSGWAQSWEIIIGDFNVAKDLWTKVANFFSEIIDTVSGARNAFLEKVMDSPLSQFAKKISGITTTTSNAIEQVTDAASDAVEVISDLGDIVDRVIRGDYGNGESRFQKLTEEGYDWAKVQNLVNEKLGSSVRHEEQLAEAQEVQTETTENLTEAQKVQAETTESLSDAKLKEIGLTDEEIKMYRQLEEESKNTGKSIDELIGEMDQLDTRTKIMEVLYTIGSSLKSVFSAMADAWKEIFTGDAAAAIRGAVDSLYNLRSHFQLSEEDIENVKNAFKGLFSILDLIRRVISGGVKFAFGILSKIFGETDINILGIVGSIGKAITSFHDWVQENDLINKAFEKLGENISWCIDKVKGWIDTIRNSSAFQTIIANFSDMGRVISIVIEWLKSLDKITFDDIIISLAVVGTAIHEVIGNILQPIASIGSNIVAGLIQGMVSGIVTLAQKVAAIGQLILITLKTVLGIHSPSTETEEVGENVMLGLAQGLNNNLDLVTDSVKGVANKIIAAFKKIDFRSIYTVVFVAGFGYIAKRVLDITSAITAPFEGVGSVLSGVGAVLQQAAKSTKKVLKSVSKAINAFAFSIKLKAVSNVAKSIAESFAIIAVSLAVLSLVNQGKMWSAVGALTVLGTLLYLLIKGLISMADSLDKLDKLNFGKIVLSVIGIAVAILVLSKAIEKLAKLNIGQIGTALAGIAGAGIILAGIIAVYGTLVKGKSAQNIASLGKTLRNIAAALGIILTVTWLTSKLDPKDFVNGALFAAGFLAFVTLLCLISKIAGKSINKLANSLLKVAEAVAILVAISILSDKLTAKGMINTLTVSGIALIICAALGKVADRYKKVLDAGKTLLSLATAIGILVVVGMVAKKLTFGGIVKLAVISWGALEIVNALGAIADKHDKMPKVTTTLLSLSLAIGVLSAVVAAVGLIPIGVLAKGLLCVGVISVLIAGLLLVTSKAQDARSNLIILTVAIGIMAAAIGLLSLIPIGNLVAASLSIAAVIAAFSLAISATGKAQKATAALIIMTVALVAIGGVLYLLRGLPAKSTLANAVALSAVLLALSAALLIVSKVKTGGLKGAASLVVLSVGLIAIAAALKILQGVTWDSIKGGLLGLAIALAALVVASAALGFVSAGALTLCAVLIAFSAALVIGALAFDIFGIAIERIAGALPVIGDGFTAIGVGIQNFVASIAATKNDIGDFVVSIGAIGTAILVFLAKISAGLIIAVAGAIAFAAAAVLLGAGLLAASIGIAATSAGILLLSVAIIALCSAISLGMEFIVTTFTNLKDFALNAGGNLVKGFAEGIKNGVNHVVEACSNFVSSIKDTICNLLGIHSPSVVAGLWGLFTGQGFANGLSESSPLLESAGKGLISKLKSIFGKDSSISSDMESDGNAIGTSLTDGLTNGINLDSIMSKIGLGGSGSGLDLSGLTSIFGSQGSDAGSAFTDSLTDSIDLDSITSKLGLGEDGSGLDLSGLTSVFNTEGDEAGSAFTDGLTDGIDLDSIVSKLGLGEDGTGLDLSGLTDSMSTQGDEAGSAFTDSLTDSIDLDSITSKLGLGEDGSGLDFSRLTDSMSTQGNEAGSAFTDSFVEGFDISSIKGVADDALDGINDKISGFADAGKDLGAALSEGISSEKESILSSMETILDGIVSKISSVKSTVSEKAKELAKSIKQYTETKKSGTSFSQGFIDGMSSKYSSVKNTAYSIGSAAVTALKNAIDQRSPSHITHKSGSYFGQGFINGINEKIKSAVSAASNLGEETINSLQNTISRVSDAILSDVDTQPTIKPVLDLTDIKSGANKINGMLGNIAPVGTINTATPFALASSAGTVSANQPENVSMSFTIYGAEGQDVNQLAELVSRKINTNLNRRNNTWR